MIKLLDWHNFNCDSGRSKIFTQKIKIYNYCDYYILFFVNVVFYLLFIFKYFVSMRDYIIIIL